MGDDSLAAGATIVCHNCGAEIAAHSRFCGVCGTPLAAAPSKGLKVSATADSRKLVTVLFADIAGFTAMSEQLDPEEVKHISDAALSRLAAVVQRFDGTVDKFMGDNIMVLFGAPTAHEDDPERAIRCALTMQSELDELSVTLKQQRGFSLELHSGINTGEVLAGSMGNTANGRDYTVMGDAVNIASRLEGEATSGMTLVGPTTYELTKHVFEFEDLGPLTIRGKREAVLAYRVLGLRAERGSGRGLDALGLSSPFVGRQSELATMQRMLGEVAAGGTAICSVIGEPGAGKSRLVRQLREQASREFALRCFTGHCLAYTSRTSYALLSDLLREVCGIALNQSGVVGTAQVQNTCAALGLDGGQPDRAAIFCRLLGFPYADPTISGLSGEDFVTVLRGALTDLLVALAQQGEGPLLLIFEDIHWADPASLATLALLPSLPRTMMLFTYRSSDNRPAVLPSAGEGVTIELGLFSEAESEEMISAALSIEDMPNEVAEQIKARGSGNPFFIEELLKLLLQSGAIVQEEGKWRFAASAVEVRVPASIHEVIQGRIDRLADEQRAMVLTAAAIGRVFNRRLLGKLVEPLPPDQLSYSLDLLNERFLIVPIAGMEQEYAFRHSLIQEVAYQSVLQSERKQLHQRIGDALTDLYPTEGKEISDQTVQLIALHYSLSDNDEGAAIYLMEAGHRAERVYAEEEAAGYYQRALERQKKLAVARPHERLRWGLAQLEAYTGLVDIYTVMGQLDEAEAAGEAGLELGAFLIPLAQQSAAYQQLGNHIAELCNRLATLFGNKRGLPERALEYINIGERALGDEHNLAWARLQVVRAYSHAVVFQPDEMFKALESALPVLEQGQDLAWLARAYYALGTAAGFSRGMEMVYDMRQRGLAIYEQLGDLRGMLNSYLSNGMVLGEMLRYDEAAAALVRAEEVANRLKSQDALAKAQVWWALIYMARGELDKAAAATTQAIRMAEATGYEPVYLDGLTYSGEVEYLRGNFEAALDFWQQGLSKCGNLALWTVDYRLRIARTLARMGRGDEAQALYDAVVGEGLEASTMLSPTVLRVETELWLGHYPQALSLSDAALAAGVSSPRNLSINRILRAQLLYLLGQIPAARDEATILYQDALRYDLPLEQAIAARVLGLTDLADGDPTAARPRLEEAVRICARGGMNAELALSRDALGQIKD